MTKKQSDLPLCCAKCDKEIDLTQEHYTGERGMAICPKCAGKQGEVGNATVSPLDPKPDLNKGANLTYSEGGMGLLGQSPLSLLPGEQNELHTRQLIRETHRNFLTIGKLLLESKENAYWSTAGKWESFSDYIESLGISKSAGYSMVACYEFQLSEKLTEDEILEIGIAKMGLLTTADKRGKMDDDTIALAKVAPVRDLKEHLGHKVIENDKENSIICPKCGEVIIGASWVKLTTK